MHCRFVLQGVWTVNSGLWAVYKLTRFTFPECWTSIEKEIVYIEMLNTRRQLFFPPVFQSPQRHDPFKWLFTCIRRRAKALLNEVLSTIQLEWTSQQHNFPLSTMLTSAEQKHWQKYEDQRPAVLTPAATECPNMSVDSHSLFVFVLLSYVKFDINEKK